MATALWALLLQEAAIPRHLEAVKDYLLLGAGDVFRTFLQEVLILAALADTGLARAVMLTVCRRGRFAPNDV